ncbi:MAG TPA: AMP-binding protein [Tepidisphaeraceae bacterium]|nr:AMP-binding protein [Tepidisphaeraceae bacterium]
MGFFHLRPNLTDPHAKAIWSTYQQLDRSQWQSPAEIESFQLERLGVLLKHCFENVPYYTRVLGDLGYPNRTIQSMDEFRRIPLMSRKLYQENMDDLLARKLPPGIVAGSKGAYTSGTNGVPVKVLKTNLDILWWNALYMRDLEWGGFHPSGTLAAIRFIAFSKEELQPALNGLALPYWKKFLHVLMENGPSFGMDVRQDPRRQIEWLNIVKPDYLIGMPSNMEFVAGLLIESGQKIPGLRMIQSLGEPLDEPARRKIEAAFGAPVKNMYCSAEAGYVASPCPSGHGLHVHGESVITEVLDEHNHPCAPGQTGRLVCTSLHNLISPFIRYDILDEVTLADGPCPCGRGLQLWKHVDGRRQPMLYLANSRRKICSGLLRGARLAGGLLQFQIIQKAVDQVVVRVVPDKTWSNENADKMRQVMWDEFEWKIPVKIEVVPRIPPGPGGKVRLIAVEVKE